VGWGRSKGRHGRDIPCGDAKAGEGEGAREERRVCASGEGGGVGVREPEAGRGGGKRLSGGPGDAVRVRDDTGTTTGWNAP